MTTERRLHVAALPAEGGSIELRGEAADHARVLRLAAGHAVVLFDGRGHLAPATVDRFDGRTLVVSVGPASRVEPDPISLTLILGMPRAGKLDDIVRAVTELGVHRIVLARTARSQHRPDQAPRKDRLEAIVREACRQSERAYAPGLEGPLDLVEAARLASDSALLLTACGRTGATPAKVEGSSATVVVGPEGGLEDDELVALDRLGYRRVSLGPHVLRVETAAVAAIAVVRHTLST